MPIFKGSRLASLVLAVACGSLLFFTGSAISAENSSTWYRQPAISPDGSTILFQAYGNIWSAASDGGGAVALTLDDAWEGYPVWSRDGSQIAFASDRFGDLDVFVMNPDGSNPTRLTFHEAADIPSDFSLDGARVLFSSPRTDSAESSYFPTRALPELYEVSVGGGAPTMLFTNPAREARWSPDGTQIVYREEKAYENEWRQRDVSSFARDIWIYDVATGTHRQVTDNPAGDHSPVWSADGAALFMLSEMDGASFNARRVDLATGASRGLTAHEVEPARGLSISGGGLLTYSYAGAIYTVQDGQVPQELDLHLTGGHLSDVPTPSGAPSSISEFAVSPDGLEIAFVARGEVFVTDTLFSDTVRITNTPVQERSVSFSPDGRAVLYAAERDGGWGIYETTLSDDNEPRFSAASEFSERLIYDVEGSDAFQPSFSPDGEKVAFLENRDEVRVINRDGSDVRTVFPAPLNYSYSDGDISFAWSPNSHWITADYSPRGYYFYTDIGIAPADGSAPPHDISMNGYQDGAPTWHAGGEVIFWFSDRYGERTHGSWGAEYDVVAAFLTEESWLRFNMTEQERSLLSAEEETESDETEPEENTGFSIETFLNLAGITSEEEITPLDLDNVEYRTARLTMHSSDITGAALTSDLSALYYLAAFEGGYDLWRHNFVDDETTKVASIGAGSASLALVGDDSRIVVLADGTLMQGEVGDEIGLSPVEVGGEVTVHSGDERAYLFDHVWRQVNDKFYDPGFHGLNWTDVGAAYQPYVGAISNNRDFAIMMSEMLGYLNASHTGMYFRAGDPSIDDDTAALGAIYETDDQPGLLLAEILPNGPLDRSALGLQAGDRIVAISGRRLGATVNPYDLLNRRAGERIRLVVQQGPRQDETSIAVRAYSRSEENQALYERWIERRRAIVEERSNGRIGYLHIQSMDDDGFRQTFSELFGRNFDKEAIVIDTRFNGGGWLHDDLITLLSGEPYFEVGVRGRIMRGAPEERWTRPSILVMNEGNYSNAHMFPYAYDLFGLGETVGMPVPGTATAVWWERLMTGDLIFGIPQVAILDQQDRPLENQQLEPTILVDNPPEAATAGGDRPLEAAVDSLLEQLGQ